MDAEKLCIRFRQCIDSLSISELEVLELGGETSKYATILFVSENFIGKALDKRLNMVYKTIDAKDYSLRRQVDMTLILLTPEERTEWEDFDKYQFPSDTNSDFPGQAAKDISPE